MKQRIGTDYFIKKVGEAKTDGGEANVRDSADWIRIAWDERDKKRMIKKNK